MQQIRIYVSPSLYRYRFGKLGLGLNQQIAMFGLVSGTYLSLRQSHRYKECVEYVYMTSFGSVASAERLSIKIM